MRQAILILSGVCVFAVSAAVMFAIMPKPLAAIDLLVIGSIATLVSLLVMFLALLATRLKSPDALVKKRRKKR